MTHSSLQANFHLVVNKLGCRRLCAALPQLGCFQCTSLPSSVLMPSLSLRSRLQRGHPLCESFSPTDILQVERPTAFCSHPGELQQRKKRMFFCLQKRFTSRWFFCCCWQYGCCQHKNVCVDFNKMTGTSSFKVIKEGGCFWKEMGVERAVEEQTQAQKSCLLPLPCSPVCTYLSAQPFCRSTGRHK